MGRFLISALFLSAVLSAYAGESGLYTMNNEIYYGDPSKTDFNKLTSGNVDYHPTMSPDGKFVLFFRLTGNYLWYVQRWKTSVDIIGTDGAVVRKLTSGSFADYDPEWSLDGSNYIYFNRYDTVKNQFLIYRTSVSSSPGDEELVSDPDFSEGGLICLKDGRLIITSSRGSKKNYSYIYSDTPGKDGFFEPPFIYALTPSPGRAGKYEQIRFQHKLNALPFHMSVSMNEKSFSCELNYSWDTFSYNGHPRWQPISMLKTLSFQMKRS